MFKSIVSVHFNTRNSQEIDFEIKDLQQSQQMRRILITIDRFSVREFNKKKAQNHPITIT